SSQRLSVRCRSAMRMRKPLSASRSQRSRARRTTWRRPSSCRSRRCRARIEELEAQAAAAPRQSGGLFGSLFGSSAPAAPRRSGAVPSVSRQAQASGAAPASPFGQQQQPARGGFLAGAAQTAMGVAGGVLLGNAIAGMLGGNEAQASEAPAPEAEPEPAADEGGGFFDGFFGGDEEI